MIEYKYVRGKEIETYQDVLDCKEDGIILSGGYWENCHYDIDILLRRNETLTMKRLQQIKDEGYSVYAREKKYRDIVFSKELDSELADLLSEFAWEYEDAALSLQDELMQNTLIKLKELVGRV